ncbi:DMT family transporter [Cohaesibacter celericrescens]|uniref:DMT family transporter n=1 Tax=Cohaesibacter celericrescens TaxID=2067669 RepID=UPI003566044C
MSDVSVTAPSAEPSSRFGVLSGKDIGLYGLMIFVWGTSWIAMASQIGVVPPVITGIYRFFIATSAMFLWAYLGKYPLQFPLRIHLRFALLGVFIFSSNFVLFYYAAGYMASGLMAVIFSLTSLVNIALTALFFGQRPSRVGIIGALMGFSGIGLIFWPEISVHAGGDDILIGLGLGMAGTLCFCMGNMVSVANKKHNLPLVSSNAWGMFYGLLWMIFIALVLDVEFVMDWSAKYWIAMVWLSIVASVVAFWGYMTLLNTIGPARAGYLTVLFPIVALLLSTIFEGYHWTLPGLVGLGAIIAGNILVMRGKNS